jgi:hypothetical protein
VLTPNNIKTLGYVQNSTSIFPRGSSATKPPMLMNDRKFEQRLYRLLYYSHKLLAQSKKTVGAGIPQCTTISGEDLKVAKPPITSPLDFITTYRCVRRFSYYH